MMRAHAIILFLIFAAIKCFPQSDNYLKGIAAIENGKYAEATTYFTSFIENSPISDKGLIYRGKSLLETGNYKSAENDFLQAAQLHNKEAYLQLAILNARQNNAKTTITFLSKYINENPGINTIELFKIKDFSPVRNTNEWYNFISNFKHSEKWETISEVEFLTGRRELNEAHNLIDKAIEKNPDDVDYHFSKSKIYEVSNNYTLAIYELNKAKNTDPENDKILTCLGNIYLKENKPSEAILCLEPAKNSHPENFNISYDLAGAYLLAGFSEKALSEISYYLSYFPENIKANIRQAEIYYSLQKYNNALTVLNKFAKTENTNPEWLLLRGKTYYKTNTYKTAAYDLSMYLDLDPNSAEANYYLGLAEQKLGNQRLACYYMKRAFKAGKKQAFSYIKDSCD